MAEFNIEELSILH